MITNSILKKSKLKRWLGQLNSSTFGVTASNSSLFVLLLILISKNIKEFIVYLYNPMKMSIKPVPNLHYKSVNQDLNMMRFLYFGASVNHKILRNSTIRRCCFNIIFLNFDADLASNLLQICSNCTEKCIICTTLHKIDANKVAKRCWHLNAQMFSLKD